MIFCPSCQFKNPVYHRYCQECGKPLYLKTMNHHSSSNTDSSCSLFGVQAKDLETLANDPMPMQQTITIRHRKPNQRSDVRDLSVMHDHPPNKTKLAILSTVPTWITPLSETPQYLDQQKRYKILTALSAPTEIDHFIEVIVIDLQPNEPPYQATATTAVLPHEATTETLSETLTNFNASTPDTRTETHQSPTIFSIQQELEPEQPDDPLSQGAASPDHDTTYTVNKPNELTIDYAPTLDLSLSSEALPQPDSNQHLTYHHSQIVHTYLSLQDQLYPSFPRLFDSWSDQGTILVIENRESLSSLKSIIGQPGIVMPQVLHWLHEMTELWSTLITYHCCRSLLEIDNIRVDEDHILCLKRLYFDSPSHQHSLQELGTLWHRLATESSLSWTESMITIYQDLVKKVIVDLETLRQRLEVVANQIYQDTVPGHENLTNIPPFSLSPDIPLDEFAKTVQNSPLNLASSPELPLSSDDEQTTTTSSIPVSSLERMNVSDEPTVVLPMQLYTLSNAGTTNIGIQRDHNEDFFVVDTHIQTTDTPSGRECRAKGLYILCDGMGGHAAGEVASALAGETLQLYFQKHWTDSLPQKSIIYNGIVLANQIIYEQNQANASEGSSRMGTTLVMLLVHDTKAAIAHVGDSRIYCFTRHQELEQLTVDHEVGQREIARGVDPTVAYSRPDAYQLTQALGPRDQEFIRPDIQFFEIHEDSLFILGSDGLTDNDLLETYCETYIEPMISSNANLEEGAINLIDLANRVNGHDNITAVLVQIKLRPKLSLLDR